MMMRLNDHGGLACTGTTWALVTLVVLALTGVALSQVWRKPTCTARLSESAA
jgi:hypothetical protein